jgi:eukaryotic-like serine/threonine-protein kinase
MEGTELGGGRYVFEGRLGRGGAATVWLACDTVLERTVAVKVLSEALASDPSWLARFRREARLAASLSHPNLVSVYDFDAGEPPYIVMAHMPGGSLYERIEASDCPGAEDLAHDLLSALEAIHAAGIIHRDIKPGNVLFAADDTACLTDFGVARPEDATQLTHKRGIFPARGDTWRRSSGRGSPRTSALTSMRPGYSFAKRWALRLRRSSTP